MEFKEWFDIIEASIGLITDPYEAMQELEIQDLAGQILNQDDLDRAYRKLQIAHHPDIHPGQESVEKTKRIVAAKELLNGFVGKTLPTSSGSSSSSSSSYSSYSRRRDNHKNYSLLEVEEWIKNIVSRRYFQFVYRDKLQYLPMDVSFSTSYSRPIGSQIKTEKLTKGNNEPNFNGLLELVKHLMAGDGAKIPEDILDLNINDNWKEAWITYKTTGNWYRSISFKAIKEAAKKEPGVGMKRDEAKQYLISKGLQELYGSHSDTFLGYQSHYDGRTIIGVLVKLQSKVLNVVKRYRRDDYGISKVEEMKLIQGIPYGQLTKEKLDQIVAYMEKRK